VRRLFKWLLDRWKSEPWPALTDDMIDRGLCWRKIDGEFYEVCEFCGGNCGQCGLTARIGNIPASMQAMVDNLARKR
jgi:hypothetical protein